MKNRLLIGLTVASILCGMFVLNTACCKKTLSMKGTTYVAEDPEKKPMDFRTETVGVLEFVDDKNVSILFPYAIDTKSISGNIGVSSELWVNGEYEKIGNSITIIFKLGKESSGIWEIEVNDDGQTLTSKAGALLTKIETK